MSNLQIHTHQINTHPKATLRLQIADLGHLIILPNDVPDFDMSIQRRAGEILAIRRECDGPNLADFLLAFCNVIYIISLTDDTIFYPT